MRESQGRTAYAAHSPLVGKPCADERIAMALDAKVCGNELIASGDYENAKKAYDEGFVRLYFSREEWDSEVLPASTKARVLQAKLPLFLNRSLCNLHFHDWTAAQWDVKKVLLAVCSNMLVATGWCSP